MKQVFYISTVMMLFSCGQSVTQDEKPKTLRSAYVGYNRGGTIRIDSLNFEKIKKPDPLDTLIGSTEFTLKGHKYLIDMYTSDLVAAIDGGAVYFELKNLGVIYYRSTAWNSYRRLKTNNDSINQVIETAIDYLLLNPALGCYEPGQLIKKDIKFRTPKVGD